MPKVIRTKEKTAYAAAYYRTHKKEFQARQVRLKEEKRAYDKKYRAARKIERRTYQAAYYRTHREEMIAAALIWQRQNPGKKRDKEKARSAKKRANGGSYTAKQWRELKVFHGNRCLGCGIAEVELLRVGLKLVPDHVLPVAKGGTSDIGNIQPLCHGKNGCNNKKAAHHIDYRSAA